MADCRTRFAPSPTGLLHLGHAFSALLCAARAKAAAGRMLLRVEDLDRSRCRPEFETAIFEDLAWLGLDWPMPVLRQSDHLPRYGAALERLAGLGLCYPCRCTRGDIRAALGAPQEGVADLVPYPGTCRGRPMFEQGPTDTIRLDLERALKLAGGPLGYVETGLGGGYQGLDPQKLMVEHGDVVLARRDGGMPAYHLAVVVDDALQGVTEVVRGADLSGATMIHRLLQALLGLPTPSYHHHALIRDETGKRLAKRDDARAIRAYRAAGATPSDIRRMVGL